MVLNLLFLCKKLWTFLVLSCCVLDSFSLWYCLNCYPLVVKWSLVKDHNSWAVKLCVSWNVFTQTWCTSRNFGTRASCSKVLDLLPLHVFKLLMLAAESFHQKLHHVPYYIDRLLNCVGMFNLGIISTFFTLRSYFINLEWLSSTYYIQVSH